MRSLLYLLAGLGGLFAVGYAFIGLFWLLGRYVRWRYARRQQRAMAAADMAARIEAAREVARQEVISDTLAAVEHDDRFAGDGLAEALRKIQEGSRG